LRSLQPTVIASGRRLIANPRRLDRPLGPENDHGLGTAERLLDLVAVLGAALDLPVPPDLVPGLLERASDGCGPRCIFALVAEEYLGHEPPSG